MAEYMVIRLIMAGKHNWTAFAVVRCKKVDSHGNITYEAV